MPKLTPDEEKQVCEILIKLGWLETEHALHSEGVRAVRDVLQCSTEDAKTILGDLRTASLLIWRSLQLRRWTLKSLCP